MFGMQKRPEMPVFVQPGSGALPVIRKERLTLPHVPPLDGRLQAHGEDSMPFRGGAKRIASMGERTRKRRKEWKNVIEKSLRKALEIS